MADLIPSTTFADGEEINEAKLYSRVFTPINNMYNTVLGGQLGDTGWILATLGNSWVAFGGAFAAPYYRKFNGMTMLIGAMKSGTTGTTVFTLPAGYRPSVERQFPVQSNAGTAQLSVFTTGIVQVTAYGSLGSNAFVGLDSVIFLAEV